MSIWNRLFVAHLDSVYSLNNQNINFQPENSAYVHNNGEQFKISIRWVIHYRENASVANSILAKVKRVTNKRPVVVIVDIRELKF